MTLSTELQSLVSQLNETEQAATAESIQRQLNQAGINPETASLDEFNNLAQSAVSEPVNPIIPQLTDGQQDSAFEYSIDQAQKLLGSGIKTFGDLIGSEFLTSEGAKIVEQQELDIQAGGYVSKYNKSFAETFGEDGVSAAVGWIWEKVNENLASSAAVIGGTAVAALTAPVSGTLAAVIGGATLVGGTALGIGEVRQELEEKGVYDKDDAATAVGVGIAIGLLDRVGAGKVLNKGGIIRAINKPDVIKGLGEKGVLKQLGSSFIAEAGTEAAQEAAIVGSAYMEGAQYTVPEVVNRLIDAGVVGGAIGAGSSTAQSGVQTVQNITENFNNANETQGQEEATTQEEPEGQQEQANQTQEEVDSKTEQDITPEPQTFGNKNGYASQENAERFGVPKAGDSSFDIVENDQGRFVVIERIEQDSAQVVDQKSITEFASKTVSAENNRELGNQAFDVYERARAGRTRVGDRLVSVSDSVNNFLERIGVSKNALQPEIAKKVEELNDLTVRVQEDPSLRNEIQEVKSQIQILRDAGRSERSKKIRKYLEINVGANFGDAIKDAQLDRASGRAASDDAARRAMLVYQEAVKRDVGSLPKEQQSGRQRAYDDLIQRVIVDSDADVRFKLKDPDLGLSEENIQTNQSGDLVYTINGVEHNAPSFLKEPLIEFIRINARERAYLTGTFFPRQFERLTQQLSETQEAVIERETELNTILDNSGGADSLSYAAFDSNTGQEWVRKILQREEANGDDSPLAQSVLLDGLNEYMSKIEGANMDVFIDGVTNSDSLSSFHDNTGGVFRREDGTTPLAVVAALGGFDSSAGLSALMRRLSSERKAGQMLIQHLDFIDQFNANPFHVSRSYKAYEGDVHEFLRSRRNPTTAQDKKIVSDYRNFVAERLATAYGLSADDASIIAASQRHIEKKLNDIDFTTPRSEKSYGFGPEAGTSYGGIFNKRGDVAPEERAFLGEVTDPSERIAHSLSRLARFRVNNEYANQVIKSSLGTGLFESKQEAIEAGVTQPQRISIADPANANKLQGMFATPELAYILQTIDESGTYDAGVGGLISRLSGATKASLTLLDPAVSAANFISGAGIVAENLPLLRDNFDIVLDEYSNAINRARGKGEKKVDLRTELGIAGGSARAQDITQQVSISGDMIKRALEIVEDKVPDAVVGGEGLLNAPLSRAYDGWTGMLMGLHKLGDEVPQKVIFRARERLAKDYYGMSDQQAAKYAADYARRTGIYAPYSPQAIKDLQKIPFIGGGFVGWYTGMLISLKEKITALGVEIEMSSDRYGRLNIPNYNSADPAMVAQAKSEFRKDIRAMTESPVGAGMVGLATGFITPSVVTLGIGAVIGGLGSMFGDDDEQVDLFDPELEEMIGRLSPEYYANIDRQVTSISGDGKSLEYINVTRLGNYGIFGEVLNELFSNDPDQSVSESVLKAMGTVTEPYLAPTFGLKNISEAVTGKDEFGNEIYKEDDTYLEKTAKASFHVAKNTVGNGFYREGSMVARSLFSDQDFNEFNGTPIELDDFIQRLAGFKPIKFDSIKGLQQRSWEANRKRRTSQKKFTSSVFTFNKLSDAQIESHLREVSNRHDEYYKTVISKVEAARYFGLSDQDIAQALSVTGVSGYKPKTGEITGNMLLVLSGKIPAYKFPADSAKNILKKFQGRSIGSEARNNLESNIKAVERIIMGGG